jgi:hypothetical protein
MPEIEHLLDKARQLAEARNHKLLPFVHHTRSSGSRCVTCARQVYVMPDPGLNGAAIGGDAIAELCIRKPSGSVRPAKRSVPAREALRSGSQALIEWDGHQGTLPGHPTCQRTRLVQGEVGAVTDAALGGPPIDGVLHSESVNISSVPSSICTGTCTMSSRVGSRSIFHRPSSSPSFTVCRS